MRGLSITGRSGKSVEPQPIGSAMKKDQGYMLRTNKSPQPHLDNFDYSVSHKSAALNNQQMTDADKIGFKRGSGDASQLGNSNQKRKTKTKEELAHLRKMMMKQRFRSGMNNNQNQAGFDAKSVADDVSGTAVSTALNHRKNTQFSLDMHSNIEGSSLSPMAGGT